MPTRVLPRPEPSPRRSRRLPRPRRWRTHLLALSDRRRCGVRATTQHARHLSRRASIGADLHTAANTRTRQIHLTAGGIAPDHPPTAGERTGVDRASRLSEIQCGGQDSATRVRQLPPRTSHSRAKATLSIEDRARDAQGVHCRQEFNGARVHMSVMSVVRAPPSARRLIRGRTTAPRGGCTALQITSASSAQLTRPPAPATPAVAPHRRPQSPKKKEGANSTFRFVSMDSDRGESAFTWQGRRELVSRVHEQL